jgi:hypothetical protein
MFRVASQQKDQPAGWEVVVGLKTASRSISSGCNHLYGVSANETNYQAYEVSRKQFRRSILLTTRGDCPMIILKLTALSALGAGSLVSLFSSEFGPDLVLAILSMVL